MKKIFLILLIIAISLGAILFLLPEKEKNNENNKEETPKTLEEIVEDKLNSLTLEEKIAQMLIVTYSSTEMTEELKTILETNKPGGFIIFSNNITTYENTLKFINDIKSTADIPLFISIDQEGGLVQRLDSLDDMEVSIIPDMLTLGNTNDETLAYETGKVIAEELRVFGINMDFAPVIDVIESPSSFIGDRSFGTNAETVSKMGLSLAKGLSENGVIPVYKHFPGHGGTTTDSHYDLPILSKTKEELLEKDLIPFKDAIKEGAEVIMIGHIAIPEISNDNTPASLSKELITNLLKNELNFNGLVITDALNMGAITNNYEEKEIYELAINAGVDLLLMPTSSTSAINTIKKSIEEGKITEEQIDNSVRKILTLKYKKLENEEILDKSYLNSKEHQEILEKIK